MKVQEYIAQIQENNNDLVLYPRADEDSKLLEDELLKIVKFAMPISWQKTMALHDFDPVSHTITEFIEFCERLEYVEIDNSGTSFTAADAGDGKHPNKRTSAQANSDQK